MRCVLIGPVWRPARWVVPFVVCVLAVLGGTAAAQQTGYTTATVEIPPMIEVIAWPQAEVELSGARLGEAWASVPLVLSLRSNTPWRVEVESDSEAGVLREFDTALGTYVDGGRTTVNPVYLQMVDGMDPVHLGSTPIVLAESAVPTGATVQHIRFHIMFRPTFDDVPLPAGHTYRVRLTYTVGMGF